MSSQVTMAEKRNKRRMWPVMGFLLIVAFTLIAYIVAPDVIVWLRQTFRQFRTAGISDQQLRLYFTAIVAALLSLIAGLIIAVSAPKKAINVKTNDLLKERVSMVADQKRRKKQQRRINREYREFVERNNK